MMRQLSILLVASALLSGCTPAIKEFAASEWQSVKSFEYGKTAKKLTGWHEIFPPEESARNAFISDLDDTYCSGPEWAEGRRMTATGLNGEVAYGGCILDVPLPYEPHRLIGRP